MEYRTLGRTGLRVSLAGLGTGGPSRLGQSAGVTAAQSHRVVRTALDLGINMFDTSPAYGGSEELLGEVLVGVPRDRYIISTKYCPQQGDRIKADPEDLMRSLEQSLRLLRVDAVDVLEYHAVGPDIYRTVIERFHPVALRAREQGKVRFLGVTETVAGDPTHRMLQVAIPEGLFDVVMVKYGILNQTAAQTVLPLARKHNVGVQIMASVRTSLRNPQEAVATINRFIDEGLLAVPRPSLDDPLGLRATSQRPFAGDAVPSLTRAAYQFAAEHEAVSSVLIGTGNPDHLRANVADLLGERLPQAQFDYLRRAYGGLAWNA